MFSRKSDTYTDFCRQNDDCNVFLFPTNFLQRLSKDKNRIVSNHYHEVSNDVLEPMAKEISKTEILKRLKSSTNFFMSEMLCKNVTLKQSPLSQIFSRVPSLHVVCRVCDAMCFLSAQNSLKD